MSEQNEQLDPMNEQPSEGLTTQDIVSASRRKDANPDAGQPAGQPAGQSIEERSARSQPAGAMPPNAPSDRQAARDQPPQRSVANREAGPQPNGPGAAPARAAGQREQTNTPPTAPIQLMPDSAADAFQARWDAIQTAFVDDPRQVVEQADSLVAEVMRQLAETFAQERASLERQWGRGGDVSTEDLRLALQRYRSFFQRLLSA